MKAKILLWMMFLFLLAGASEGALVGYWDFDEGTGIRAYDYSGKGNDANVTGTLWNNTYKLGNHSVGNWSAGNTLNLSGSTNPFFASNTTSRSYSFWIQANSWSNAVRPVRDRTTTGIFDVQYYTASTEFQARYYDGVASAYKVTNISGLSTGVWYYVVSTWNGTTATLYINGTAIQSTEVGTPNNAGTASSFRLGTDENGASLFDGMIDDFSVWNESLTQATITELYNNGLGKRADQLGAGVNNFSIVAQNIYDSSTINVFNVTIDGVIYGTTTGTITTGILQNATRLYDLNLTVPNHFNTTYLSYNVSSNLSAKIIQAIVRINPLDLNNDSLSLPFNLSTTSYYNNSNLLYLKNTSIAITFQKAGYKNQTQTFDISALQNNTLDLTGIYQSILNITAANKAGAAITSFSINITNSEYSAVLSTTNGSRIIPVLNTKYNVTIDAENYEVKTAQVNISTDYTYNFSLYGTNTLNITFKNELTGALLSGINISVNLFGAVNYTNSSTATGNYFISLLYPSTYTIRYSSPGYPERFYYFTMINRTVQDLTLYLLANPSNITITVYDEISHYVQGATVKAQRYDLTTNSYILVEMIETNFEGQGIMHLQKFTEFYKFVIEYAGVTKLTTTPTYIYTDSLTFQINLASDIGEDYYNSQNINWELTFNNATNNFRFFYNDPANVVSQGCLYVYTTDLINDEVLWNSSCSSSTSSTLLAGVAAVNGTTYRAKAVVTFSDGDYTLGDMFKSFAGEYVTNKMGLFAILILTIVLLMIGYWNPSIAVVLAPLPAIFGSMIHLIDIHFTYLIPIEVLAIIIAVIISRKA